nr:hypothetical protein [Tanacetum cinerariifolium]
AATAQSRKLPVCYDDDDDEDESNSLKDNIISEIPSCSAVTPSEPIDSLKRLLHDDPIPLPDTLDFSYEVRIFLPFFTYPPGSSHRHGAFKKFNTHRSHLNEWPMTINGKNTPILDVLLFHFYPP